MKKKKETSRKAYKIENPRINLSLQLQSAFRCRIKLADAMLPAKKKKEIGAAVAVDANVLFVKVNFYD